MQGSLEQRNIRSHQRGVRIIAREFRWSPLDFGGMYRLFGAMSTKHRGKERNLRKIARKFRCVQRNFGWKERNFGWKATQRRLAGSEIVCVSPDVFRYPAGVPRCFLLGLCRIVRIFGAMQRNGCIWPSVVSRQRSDFTARLMTILDYTGSSLCLLMNCHDCREISYPIQTDPKRSLLPRIVLLQHDGQFMTHCPDNVPIAFH